MYRHYCCNLEGPNFCSECGAPLLYSPIYETSPPWHGRHIFYEHHHHLSKEEEKEILESKKKYLERRLSEINQRLEELK